MKVSMSILNAAYMAVVRRVAERNYPEDDWCSLTDNWDINIFREPGGLPSATLYPVVDGNTLTEEGLSFMKHGLPLIVDVSDNECDIVRTTSREPEPLGSLADWSTMAHDPESGFTEHFCPKAWMLESVSWSRNYMYFTYILEEGRHIADQVKMSEWLEFLTTLKGNLAPRTVKTESLVVQDTELQFE